MFSVIADYFEPSVIEKAGGSVCPSDESQLAVGSDVDYHAILDRLVRVSQHLSVSVPHRTYYEVTDFHLRPRTLQDTSIACDLSV